jgi:hypothetical protein
MRIKTNAMVAEYTRMAGFIRPDCTVVAPCLLVVAISLQQRPDGLPVLDREAIHGGYAPVDAAAIGLAALRSGREDESIEKKGKGEFEATAGRWRGSKGVKLFLREWYLSR